jgi:hypothetical protein
MSENLNVDLVFVIDTSISMAPCIEGLRLHLRELIKPMQGYVANIRFGIVGLSASSFKGEIVYTPQTLAGGIESIPWLYRASNQYNFFTDNPDEIIARLDSLEVAGNEDNLVALDIALDHPFGPSSTHKRVVALFSDEKIETGIPRPGITDQIPALIEKLHARKIKLFCAMPYSPAIQHLSEANGSEIDDIGEGNGFADVDFKLLLSQMGKSISVASLQSGLDVPYKKAIFGQDNWT